MSADTKKPSQAQRDLRARAEKAAAHIKHERKPPENGDLAELLHELSVQQIALEIQDEELRATLEDLDSTRSRFREYVDTAPVAILHFHSAGDLVEFNIEASRLFGLNEVARGAAAAARVFRRLHHDDTGTFRDILEKGREGSCTGRIRIEPENGSPRVYAVSASPCTECPEAGADGAVWSLDKMRGLMHPDDWEPVMTVAREHIEGRRPVSDVFYRFRRPGGKWGWVHSIGRAFASADTEAPSLFGIIGDVTIEKEHELALQESNARLRAARELAESANRAKSDFLANMSHEIRTVRSAIEEKGLEFQLVMDPNLPDCLEGDELRIRQILLNLVGNAVKFTDAGSVTVTARAKPHGRADFEVADTGIGIPASEIPRIFESFHQLDSSRTRRHGGTGLGLAISKRLAESMRGTLTVESEPGRGSTFRLSLPLKAVGRAHTPDPPTPPPKTPEAALASRYPMEILVAEDNAVNRRLAVRMLEKFGYHPSCAENGVEVLSSVTAHRYDLILMDIRMPVMDGLEACREIQRRLPPDKRPAMVALTANALPEDRRLYLDAGMRRVITKPFRKTELAAAIEAIGREK